MFSFWENFVSRRPSYGFSYSHCGVILKWFQFSVKKLTKCFIIYCISVILVRPNEWLINCKKCRSWKDILEFENNTDSLIYLWLYFVKMIYKIYHFISCTPKGFGKFVWSTGMLLKVRGGWDAINIWREKNLHELV